MLSSLLGFLSAQDYVPHGLCLLWQPQLLWLHVFSDAVISFAYFTIPFALVYFVARRRDLAFRGIFVLTGIFILACGTTHAMGVLTVWYPAYWLDGVIKAVTAVASIITSYVMWRAMPLALALPSAEQLEAANQRLTVALSDLTRQVAQRRRAEEMLRQSEKMKALGQLTGGVAHDFNNLLGVIIGCTEFLMEALEDKSEQAQLAREILDSALSGSLLTRRLLAVGRNQPLRPQHVDLTALVQDNVEMLRRTLGEAITVSAKPASDIWLTRADPSQIRDVLLNLALNSRDAMPHGGCLTIEVANVHLDTAAIVGYPELVEGDYVALSVIDTGAGMPQEVIERAVEPFFTTKPPTAGSGLGLSMAYGFAKQSGGHLDIWSKLGCGTTVRLLLPRDVEEAAAPAIEPRLEPADPGGDETILVVDDNQALRELTRRHLTALGYKVMTAPDGHSALTILRSDETVDLLFTDVVMPEGMSGHVLAEATRRLRPHIKVLFTTGYVAGEYTDKATLHKPYDRHELASAIRTALDPAAALPAVHKRL